MSKENVLINKTEHAHEPNHCCKKNHEHEHHHEEEHEEHDQYCCNKETQRWRDYGTCELREPIYVDKRCDLRRQIADA